jgi:hypothetical protein
MKTYFEVTQLTKGFSLEIKSITGGAENGLMESYGFKTREDLGGFLMDYFTKPKRPNIIRRKKPSAKVDIATTIN